MRERWVLQLCHCHYGPFLDVARQYAALFDGSPFKVLTVYLTGAPSDEAERASASNEVCFMGYSSNEIRGLKLNAIRKLRAIIAGRDVALVVAHRFKPIYVACLATRAPVIGVHHAFGDYDRASRRWFAAAFKARLALIGVSDAVRDDIRAKLPSWSADRVETLYNRLDVNSAFAQLKQRGLARQELGLPRDAIIVGNVGRLHPDKDQTTLLHAFAKARPQLPPETYLAIAGSGPLEARLRQLANTLNIGDKTVFLGQVEGIRRFFRAFDLFVLSSDREPFGMVLIEAIAAQIPVLATDSGGAPEIVREREMLFALGDVDALARSIESVLGEGSSSLRQRFVRQARQRLTAEFSDDAARRRFLALPMVRSALSPPYRVSRGRT